MAREELLLLALLACVTWMKTVASLKYEFVLSDIDHFVEENSDQPPEARDCRVCLLEPEKQQELCKEATNSSIDDYNFFVKVTNDQPAVNVTVARTMNTIFGIRKDTLTVCKCSSEPTIYLTDGIWRNRVAFMVNGYRDGDRVKIHGLKLPEWKAYLDDAKKRFPGKGSTQLCEGDGKEEKLRNSIAQFLEMRKHRKASDEKVDQKNEDQGAGNIFPNEAAASEDSCVSGPLSKLIAIVRNLEWPHFEGAPSAEIET